MLCLVRFVCYSFGFNVGSILSYEVLSVFNTVFDKVFDCLIERVLMGLV